MSSFPNGGLSGDVPNKRPVENGYIPKYKPRKISAVRDFPPMCGHNSVPIIVEEEQFGADADGVVGGDNSKISEVTNVAMVNDVGNHGIANSMESEAEDILEGQLDEAVKSTTDVDIAEDVDAVKEEVMVNETLVVEIEPTGIQTPKDDEFFTDSIVNNHIAVEGAESLGALVGEVTTTAGMDGDFIGVDELITETELMGIDNLNNGTKKISSKEEDTVAGNSVASIKPKDKYRLRTVSAIREFPPNCGRNVLLPNDEGRQMATLGNLEKIVNDELEPETSMSRDVLEEEAARECLDDELEDIVDSGLASNHLKEIEMSQGLVRESGWEENENRKSDGEDKVLFPHDGSNVGVDLHRGVVVHGLMAAPYCPWRKGKRDLKNSSGSARRIKVRKKTHADGSPGSSTFMGKEDGHALAGRPQAIIPISMFMPQPDDREDDCTEPIGNEIAIYSPGQSDDIQHSHGVHPEADDCSGANRKRNFDNYDGGKNRDQKGKQKHSWRDKAKAVAKKSIPEVKSPRLSFKKKLDADGNLGALVPVDDNQDEASNHKRRGFKVSYGSSHGDARNRVRDTLRTFHVFYRKILQQEEAQSTLEDEGQSKQSGKKPKRIDLQTVNMMKENGKVVNTEKQYLGHVPGVEVGDEFQYRVELAVVGLHRHYQAGIDSMELNNKRVCTSIVSSGAYGDNVDNADVLIYSGQGGNIIGKSKEPEDQKLEGGNLALRNSILEQTPVRVIRGWKVSRYVDPQDLRPKMVAIYVYDGLYTVKNYWTETGSHGKQVFMFELRRNPGQPELAWKELKESSKSKIRKGVCVNDISGGKERFPICAVNTLDDEKPPSFNYTSKMIYPKWYKAIPPAGCDCTGKCSGSRRCRCTIRNGGEVPYNHNGAIVETKPLVYECGPHCKCPPSCYNRVTQRGIKVKLEIFKTESRGWGLRAPSSIPSGTFICEYAGELLEDKEAEERIGNDEYLFDIGPNYSDSSVKPEEQTASTELVEGGYTIDAGQYGNIGRFINHSCSPNLYAQNVIYDHDDKRMPHVMLFAMENIPPLQELTYHYNYSIDQIHDSNGNIKVKKCYCGSAECSGRMY